MTRAREHLILSCAPSNRRSSGSFLAMLDETLNGAIGAADTAKSVSVGNGTIEIEVVSETLSAPSRCKEQNPARQEKSQLATLRRHLDAPHGGL